MRERLRVSSISYLNTVPLVWSLLRHPPENLEFEFTVPSQCARDLEHGRADIGLIPAIEYQRIPGLAVLAGPVIAARERIRSILLLSRKPLEEVRTVAADTSSRTSLALAEVILRGRYGAEPAFHMRAPEPAMMLKECDAAVLIGDPALECNVRPVPGVRTVDLATEWRAWTGLAFVFAFWALPLHLATPELAQVFVEARDRGIEAIPKYAAEEARRRGLPLELVLDYLTRCVHYDLDAECRQGLERFYELAAAHKLIPGVAPLKLIQPAAGAGHHGGTARRSHKWRVASDE